MELFTDDCGRSKRRLAVSEDAFENVSHHFQWTPAVTIPFQSVGIRVHEGLWTKQLPLDDVNKLMKMMRFILVHLVSRKESVEIGNSRRIHVLEIRELGQAERAERRRWNFGNINDLRCREQLRRKIEWQPLESK